MNEQLYPALACAVFSLVAGLSLLLIVIFRAPKYFNTINKISWLLIALVPVFPIFAIFPDSSFSFTTKGVTAGGAIGAFIFIWLKGMRITREAYEVDVLQAQIKDLLERLRRPIKLPAGEKIMYAVKNGKQIGLITGDITEARDIDVWVSSENTNMEMARFFDRSVSATIRYNGSKRDENGRVIEKRDAAGIVIENGDIIAEELKKKKGAEFYVAPATVFVTSPGELVKKGVKQIFHVAAVHGTPSTGYLPVPDLDTCMIKALERTEDFKYKSILFPLLATGTARADLDATADLLISTALSYLEADNPNRVIDTVYFLAWTDFDRAACKKAFSRLAGRVTPVTQN